MRTISKWLELGCFSPGIAIFALGEKTGMSVHSWFLPESSDSLSRNRASIGGLPMAKKNILYK